MITICAEAYFQGRCQVILHRGEGNRVFARLEVPVAASFDSDRDLTDEEANSIRSMTGQTFLLKAASALQSVYDSGQAVYPTEQELSPLVEIALTRHVSAEGWVSLVSSTLAVTLREIRSGSVPALVLRTPNVIDLGMYPADWSRLLTSVRDLGHNPYDVSSVLAFLSRIDHDQAEVWLQKVQSFRDLPESWAHLVMRELGEVDSVDKFRPPAFPVRRSKL